MEQYNIYRRVWTTKAYLKVIDNCLKVSRLYNTNQLHHSGWVQLAIIVMKNLSGEVLAIPLQLQ